MKFEKIIQVLDAYEDRIEHYGYVVQSIPCCDSHVLLSEARDELREIMDYVKPLPEFRR